MSPRVLVFSKTAGYRHESIAEGRRGLEELGRARGFAVEATEDAATFSPAGLAGFDVVVFLNTSGSVLDAAQKAALERFVRGGRGYVGIHCASCTELEWSWYGGLVGAYFTAHPPVQTAEVVVEDGEHPATRGLPARFAWTDEWYGFGRNPRSDVRVLLSVDEASYQAGEGAMGADHPIAWCREYDGGRAFYTALGHSGESYFDPLFTAHLGGALEWAAGLTGTAGP